MPALLEAEQAVYGALAPTHSPRGRGGYQVAFASSGLAETDLDALEPLLASFPEHAGDVERWQFFPFTDGRQVLVRSQIVPPDPEMSGTRTTFFAHALVVDPAPFQASDSNPFHWFDGTRFLRSPRHAIERLGRDSWRVPRATVEPSPSSPHAPWLRGTQVRSLLALAWQADRLIQERRSLLLEGNPREIESLLRVVFHFLPLECRAACSFDSLAPIARQRTHGLWALGAAAAPSDQERLIVISTDPARAPTVPSSTASASIPGQSTYARQLERWLDTPEPPSGAEVRLAPELRLLLSILDGPAPVSLAERPSRRGLELALELLPDRVLTRVQEVLRQVTPSGLHRRFLNALATARLSVEWVAVALGSDANHRFLAAWIASNLLESPPKLAEEEAVSLARLGSESGCAQLMVLAAGLGRRDLPEERRAALEVLDAEHYARLLVLVPDRLAPGTVALAHHGAALLAHLAHRDTRPAVIVDAILALRDREWNGPWEPILPKLDSLDCRALELLEEGLNTRGEVDPGLRAALALRRESLGTKSSWWKRTFGG